MLTKMRNIVRMTWRQIYASTRALLPTIGAAEQTMSSWAKAIKAYAAVPDVYKGFFIPLRAERRVFPYTVLTPSYEGFIHRTTEKLVCDLGANTYAYDYQYLSSGYNIANKCTTLV